jgi:hypothetical protein
MSVTGVAGFPPRPSPHESWNIPFPQMWICEGGPPKVLSLRFSHQTRSSSTLSPQQSLDTIGYK